MKITGSIQDPYALQHPEYRYRKPVYRPLDLRSVDPDRLDPLHEYPRDTRITDPGLETIGLADYEVLFLKGADERESCTIRVSLLPNQYTDAQVPKTLLVFEAAFGHLHADLYHTLALEAAFAVER